MPGEVKCFVKVLLRSKNVAWAGYSKEKKDSLPAVVETLKFVLATHGAAISLKDFEDSK